MVLAIISLFYVFDCLVIPLFLLLPYTNDMWHRNGPCYDEDDGRWKLPKTILFKESLTCTDHRQMKTSVLEGNVQSVTTQVFAECSSGYTVGKT